MESYLGEVYLYSSFDPAILILGINSGDWLVEYRHINILIIVYLYKEWERSPWYMSKWKKKPQDVIFLFIYFLQKETQSINKELKKRLSIGWLWNVMEGKGRDVRLRNLSMPFYVI